MMLKAHKLGHTMERPSLCLFAGAWWRLCFVKVLSNLGESMEFPIDAKQLNIEKWRLVSGWNENKLLKQVNTLLHDETATV